MTTTTLAAALLKDVPRYASLDGNLMFEHELLFSLSAALDPAIAERAGEHVTLLSMSPWSDGYPRLYELPDLITALLTANAALRAERDELRATIFGSPDYDPALRNGNFREMAETLHASRAGGVARAEAAEAERAALEKHIEGTAKDTHKLLVTAEAQRAVLTARLEGLTGAIAAEALRYADFYEVGSDPRNTFVMFAEWVETRAALSTTEGGK